MAKLEECVISEVRCWRQEEVDSTVHVVNSNL